MGCESHVSATAEHEKWMQIALQEAEKAHRKQEVPVGAVVVYEGKIIGRGHNLVESLQDPTAHAEVIAITAAANSLASWRLEDTTLYVTLEPCPMCAGAVALARVPRVVYGASDPRWGACGSVWDVFSERKLDTHPKVVSGVLAAQGVGLLKEFFESLRSRE